MERSAPIHTADPFDSRQFRSAVGRFATGVTVITTEQQGTIHGMTANAFMSVSLAPPLIVVSVDNRARMSEHLLEGSLFGVSVLGEDQESLSGHFAGRPVEGLSIEFVQANEIPVINGALAHLVAQVVDIHGAGDHSLYIGQVEYLAWCEGRPLLFFGGQYRHLTPVQLGLPPLREDEFSLFSIGEFHKLVPKDSGGTQT